MWFLAPPRACTRLPARLARSYTYSAIGVEPTKLIEATSGWSSRPSTATLSPCSTVKTPSGRPASCQSSAIQIAAEGSFSLGLRTTVLPAAIAMGKNHIGTIAGKLNGLMMPTTPSGWRIECTSTPVETCGELPPLSRCGMPQATSTTSWPRATSPRASERTLPCSAVMIAASSSLRELSSSRNANTTCVRALTDVAAQSTDALRAEATAASISSGPAKATRPLTSPVAGFVTSPARAPAPVAEPGWVLPSIQCPMVGGVVCIHPSCRAGPPSARDSAAPGRLCRRRSVADEVDRLPVLGEGQRMVVERRDVRRVDAPVVAAQQPVHDRLDLGAGEVEADALVHAAAERRPGEPVRLVLATLGGEALGVPRGGVGPVVLEQVRVLDGDHHVLVGRDPHALDDGLLNGLADHDRHRRAQPQRLLHHQVDRRQRLELGQGGLRAERQRLLAAALLPLGVLAEVLQDRGGRDGGRVVRGHHQEDHVVDDVVVGEALAVLGLDVAEHGEDVVGAGRPAGGQVAAQEVLEHAAPSVGAAPAGERHVGADDPGGGLDAGDEGLVDLLHLLAARGLRAAHEDVGGDVERELLEPPVGLEA